MPMHDAAPTTHHLAMHALQLHVGLGANVHCFADATQTAQTAHGVTVSGTGTGARWTQATGQLAVVLWVQRRRAIAVHSSSSHIHELLLPALRLLTEAELRGQGDQGRMDCVGAKYDHGGNVMTATPSKQVPLLVLDCRRFWGASRCSPAVLAVLLLQSAPKFSYPRKTASVEGATCYTVERAAYYGI